MKSKQCPKCKQVKALTEYWKASSSKDKHALTCKDCAKSYYSKYSPGYYLKNKKSIDIKEKENRLKNLEKYNANARIASKVRYAGHTPGVYLATFKEGTYVGESRVVENRNKFHRLGNSNVNDGSLSFIKYQILEEIQDEAPRKQREEYWIKKLKPTLNIKCVDYK
tara:strand:- start:1188 stop:1685 length:498 start_codon:yes stop_codon:yes gene_type:complete